MGAISIWSYCHLKTFSDICKETNRFATLAELWKCNSQFWSGHQLAFETLHRSGKFYSILFYLLSGSVGRRLYEAIHFAVNCYFSARSWEPHLRFDRNLTLPNTRLLYITCKIYPFGRRLVFSNTPSTYKM